MKSVIFSLATICAATALASAPVVVPSSVTMAQDGSRKVTIGYQLSGEPGIVTIDIQTNFTDGVETKWASIGGKHLTHMYGDVNRMNTNITSPSVAYWQPDKAWPEGGVIADGGVRAVVTAWATNAPPDYVVVDFELPGTLSFYATADAIPGGVTSRVYKTSKMVMRKIPAAGVTWRMGSPTTETGRDSYEQPFLAVLSEDYYLGIYEVTKAQWLNGTKGLTWIRSLMTFNYTGDDVDVHPCDQVSNNMLRGNTAFDWWPNDGHRVSPAYGIAGFRTNCNSRLLFDLPTLAQWEYACRAGNPDPYGWATATDGIWCSDNAEGHTHEVGTRAPNAWGLYDMQGNVSELMIDPVYSMPSGSQEAVVDPTGPETASGNSVINRFAAGGGFDSALTGCRAAARTAIHRDAARANLTSSGFRLWAPAVITY